MKTSLIYICLFLLLPSVSMAQLTGNDLQKTCMHVSKEKITLEEVRDINFCLGYVSAFVESHYQIYLVDEDRGFCLGQESYREVASTVSDYLEKHPEALKLDAYFALDASLRATYLCE